MCFFGDDVNDLAAMELTGLCACPANAAAEVLAYVASGRLWGPDSSPDSLEVAEPCGSSPTPC